MTRIEFHNSTQLASLRLLRLCRDALTGWTVGLITLRVRYSRGADFSGTCFYADRRIFVNLGRHLAYPYRMYTNLARARSYGNYWYRSAYVIELTSGYEVVLFVFLHELYHLLVSKAHRNTRQKEAMCDRFAARYLVDRFGAVVRTDKGAPVPRTEWDFQDLDGFVAAARDSRVLRPSVVAHKRRRRMTDSSKKLPLT